MLLLNTAHARLYWVFLVDDPGRPPAVISEKAADRVALRGNLRIPGSKLVLPDHIAEIEFLGFKIKTASRFLNAVSVDVQSEEDIYTLKQLPFVIDMQPVGQRPSRKPVAFDSETSLARITQFEYGDSYTQNAMLGIPALHNYGYDGAGVLIGIFDTGFNQVHPAFDAMDIVKTYDFVDQEVDVTTTYLSNHGDDVLSVIGGYAPGELIGPAYGASYLLARTENIGSETRQEEHNWMAAVEWADSLGVDIISSSLVYFDFDGTGEDYPISALDGQTTIVAQAANIAAARGILVVNANGNDGPGDMTLWPPADSPDVLSVGAVGPDEVITGFSGRGPTYDGRIKPDVVAQGSSVQMVSGTSGYKLGQGTSYSTPAVAGLAALLLQAAPDISPDSIISIFKANGDRASNPDNIYGYGIPQFAYLFEPIGGDQFLNNLTFPNPSTYDFIHLVLPHRIPGDVDDAKLYNIRGQYLGELAVEKVSGTTLRLNLPDDTLLADQLLIASVRIDDKRYTGKFVYIKS